MIVHSFLIADSEKYGKDQVISDMLKYIETSKKATKDELESAESFNECYAGQNAERIKMALSYADENGYTNIREEKHYMKEVYYPKWQMVDHKCARVKIVQFNR